MSLQLLLYVSLSLWIMRTMVFAVRMSKPNCPEKCGHVEIPFPFGIGQNCSGSSSFIIDCRNNTYHDQVPFLDILDLELEVLRIYLSLDLVMVNERVSPNCSSEDKCLPSGKTLLGTPFNISKDYSGLLTLSWEFPAVDLNQGRSCSDRSCECSDVFEGNPYLGNYRCQKEKKYRGKMAFIGVGAGLGALVLLVSALTSYKVIRRRIKANRKQKFFRHNGGLLLEQQLSSTQNSVDRTKLFSSKELEIATDHFNVNRILGRGGQGTVYKGMLSNGIIVAVKKSQKVDEDDLEVFINEVVILSQINHRNVVKLLGCCLETEVPLLVYELIPNDTLFQHIHNPTEEFPLTWERRLRIATEVASALSYLHSATSFPIYHRDIKSTNILLDDKYRAKVSDFGTSRSIAIDQTHVTTKVIGTFGYLDPEYLQSSQFTEKSDVYSFGVVMVELLTGKKAISSIRSRDEGKSLATNFLQAMKENCLHDILDAGMLNDDTKPEIMAIAQLARRCLYLNGKRRPTMKEVATELEAIPMSKQGSSSVQDNLRDADVERHSIVEVSEVYDFASISESIQFDNVTTSDVDSLLFATP